MKKAIFGLAAIAVMGIMSVVQALPHDNRGDVEKQVEVFIPYTDFNLAVSGSSLASISSSSSVVTYIPTGRMAALRMTASNQDVPLFLAVPDNACINSCPVQFGVVWSTGSTNTANSVTWRIRYQAIGDGEALLNDSTASTESGTIVSSNVRTALSTAISADAVDGDSYALQETPLGTINQDVLSRGDMLQLLVEMQSTTGAVAGAEGLNPINEQILLHGINFYYTRELL